MPPEVEPEQTFPSTLPLAHVSGIARALGDQMGAVIDRFGPQGAEVVSYYEIATLAALRDSLMEVNDNDVLRHTAFLARREPDYYGVEPHVPLGRQAVIRYALQRQAARAHEVGEVCAAEAAGLLAGLFAAEPPAVLSFAAGSKKLAALLLGSHARAPRSRDSTHRLGGFAAESAR